MSKFANKSVYTLVAAVSGTVLSGLIFATLQTDDQVGITRAAHVASTLVKMADADSTSGGATDSTGWW